MQWAVVQGATQTAQRAEDLGLLAALFSPLPIIAAIDNAATVTYMQHLTRAGGPPKTWRREANQDARAAIA
eukprot:10732745-Lingulodinium_polyedra.AAC.1